MEHQINAMFSSHKVSDTQSTRSIVACLNSYKYLDDLNYDIDERIKQKAKMKYYHIMRNIRSTKDDYDSADSDSDAGDVSNKGSKKIDSSCSNTSKKCSHSSHDLGEDESNQFLNILKRHKQRLKREIRAKGKPPIIETKTDSQLWIKNHGIGLTQEYNDSEKIEVTNDVQFNDNIEG